MSTESIAPPPFRNRPPTFNHVELAALATLKAARREMLDTKIALRDLALLPSARTRLEQKHDRAAQKVTAARFDLDTALDAAEDV